MWNVAKRAEAFPGSFPARSLDGTSMHLPCSPRPEPLNAVFTCSRCFGGVHKYDIWGDRLDLRARLNLQKRSGGVEQLADMRLAR